MREVMMTALFKSDLDSLDNSIRARVPKTLALIQQDPSYPGLETHPHSQVPNRKIMRSRVNDNFRILWEWAEHGNILLWRIGAHNMIDSVAYIRSSPKGHTSFFVRDDDDNRAVELTNLHADITQTAPFKNVPDNILRLFGVPDGQLEAVKSLTDAERVWDLAIPDNVQSTLLDILTNPGWTLDDLLDKRQLLYRATVDQLEGYCEGRIKRLLLNLNDEQQSFVHIRAHGPVLIKGVAGSGKTTIGLYRAQYLAQAMQQQSRLFDQRACILLLTYTKTLTKALEQLYGEKFGALPQALSVQGFKEWMLQQLRSRDIWLNEAKRRTRESIIRDAQRQISRLYPRDTVVTMRTPAYLLAEIDQVIRARALASLEDYQAVERVGRGIGLDRQRHRPIVWHIYRQYQDELDRRGLFDWADLARLVQKHCNPLPMYDVVIIDEAQDLPPSDLRLATRLLPDYSGLRSLTLLADPAQSIYYRGIPWKEAGIRIQGRTRTLAKNYRNTREILAAARHIVEGCEDLKAGDEFIPPTSARRFGPKPILMQYDSAEESMRLLAGEIVRLCQSGNYRLGDIAVLARNNGFLSKWVEKSLRNNNIQCRFFRDSDFHILENEVKLITMHSAKGLEYPIVFLVGLADSYMPYIAKDSATKAEDELQERKLFYVSMTRAAERLYLFHPRRNRCRFLRDLDAATITAK